LGVSTFAEALRAIAARVPETQVLMIMGTDGIPIERLVVRPDPNLEAVAAEYTTLLRASVSAAGDTGLGELQEMSVVTEKLTALLVGITGEYFLFAALAPGALTGRARFAMRLAGLALQREFQ
jgi:predicted regulator of Ras-like GTPase activity (Roadblock/LC7/MglB family)